MLSTSDLAGMRETVNELMDHLVTVERASGDVLDDYGQPILSWGSSAEVAAQIAPKSAREVALLSQGGAVVSAVTIRVPIRTDVTPADRIHHDPTACMVPAHDIADVTYQLTAVQDPSGDALHLRCDATEIS